MVWWRSLAYPSFGIGMLWQGLVFLSSDLMGTDEAAAGSGTESGDGRRRAQADGTKARPNTEKLSAVVKSLLVNCG